MTKELEKEIWRAPAFPTTHWPELIEAALWTDDRSGKIMQGEEALGSFFKRYTPPLKRFASALIKHRVELSYLDADDLIQTFFSIHILDKNFIGSAKSSTGNKFRTYLMRSVRNHIYSTHQAQMAIKRGGGAIHYSLERDGICEEPGEIGWVDSGIDVSWFANVVSLALRRMANSSKSRARKRQLRAFYLRYFHACVSAEVPPDFSVIAETIGARSNKDASNDCAAGKVAFMTALRTEFQLHCTASQEISFEEATLFRLIENHFNLFCECLGMLILPDFMS